MSQKVFILGDSFGDANWPIEHDYGFVWPHKLSEKYDVVNLACVGTGPEYAIDRLFTLIKSWPDDIAQSYLIFIHSDVNRLNLSCYNNVWEQSHVYAIADGTIKHQSHVFLKQAFKWYINPNWGYQQNVKNFCTIKYMSQYFKRVLFWPIDTTILKLPGCSSYNDSSDNMTTVDKGLYEISTLDCGEDLSSFIQDPRPNHLQEINHMLMYQQMVNWIENNKPIDTSKFKFVSNLENQSDV